MQFLVMKDDPARKRRALAAIKEWLTQINIDPQADCFGNPAMNCLYQRLRPGPYNAGPEVLVGPNFELDVADVKTFLWGITYEGDVSLEAEAVTIPIQEPELEPEPATDYDPEAEYDPYGFEPAAEDDEE